MPSVVSRMYRLIACCLSRRRLGRCRAAEQKEQQDADIREEEDRQQPRHRGLRFAVARDDDQRDDTDDEVDDDEKDRKDQDDVGGVHLAEVHELQRHVEVAALEQRHGGLQVVAALGLHAQLVALDLRLDALRRLVADDLGDLLRVVLGDALLERRVDAVLLARRVRLTRVQSCAARSRA